MITIWRRWPSSVSSKKSRSISVWITSACSQVYDIATAAVKLACGEEVKAEAANGNGPVDAVYQAINRITDYNVELVKYSLTAKGHGKDALGQVDIVANYNGRRFHGVGLATDIVESSAKAMVHVLNNIWRAAEVEKELQRKAQHNENNKETV